MLHALYIVAFALLSALAVSNLFRNLMLLGTNGRSGSRNSANGTGDRDRRSSQSSPHPEMLDERGRVLDEPLLVMKSISVEDAREQLDALYENSSGGSVDTTSEDEGA
jgi:hypothetical protein